MLSIFYTEKLKVKRLKQTHRLFPCKTLWLLNLILAS